jgi:hypothetical protein
VGYGCEGGGALIHRGEQGSSPLSVMAESRHTKPEKDRSYLKPSLRRSPSSPACSLGATVAIGLVFR